MGKRVTIQDIADALDLSRNTVSKALNNTGVLAEDTRQRILAKAAEMGYKQFIYLKPEAQGLSRAPQVRELALLTQSMPNSSHFGSALLNTFQEQISRKHYRLSIFLVRQEEIDSLRLPLGLDTQRISGILCMELFHAGYNQMLGTLGIPLLFVDNASFLDFSRVDADFLLMENHNSIYRITNRLIKNGCRRLAFAGDVHHCRSFFERYQGFLDALSANGLTPALASFAEPDAFANAENLSELIGRTPELPQAFVCANDFVAIDLIRALKKRRIRVPEDVLIVGFDNSAESRIIEPHLTTVHIPSLEMGFLAADLLLSRIERPETPYRIMHVRTAVKYRDSTGSLTPEEEADSL